jgi:hypothetical protein
MTVVIVPTLLLWVLIALFALTGAATLYKMWLQRKLDKASAPKLRGMTEADFRVAHGGIEAAGRRAMKQRQIHKSGDWIDP